MRDTLNETAPVTGALRVARDEGSPASVVAGLAALVPALLAARDAAQELVVVAASPVFLAVERADVALQGVAAERVAPAASPVSPAAEQADVALQGVAAERVAPAASPADVGESAVFAAPVLRA